MSWPDLVIPRLLMELNVDESMQQLTQIDLYAALRLFL